VANELFIAGGNVPDQHRPSVFDRDKFKNKLSAGVGAGFASLRYKGGRWAIKFQGATVPLVRYRQEGQNWINDGPNPFLDCIIIDVAERPAKYYYEGRYVEGDQTPPDCWSSNGVKPDSGAPKKQSPTCAGCRWNQWGTAVGPDGAPSRGKRCSDHKRLAVVPAADIENVAYGGPMLLQVPPTSLKKLSPYEGKLAQGGYIFPEVWTRIAFDPASAFPLFEFAAVRPLTEDEQLRVQKQQENPLTKRMLEQEITVAEAYDDPTMATQTAAGPTTTGEPDPYQYTPDKKHRWKAGMAAWEPVPEAAPPPPPPPAQQAAPPPPPPVTPPPVSAPPMTASPMPPPPEQAPAQQGNGAAGPAVITPPTQGQQLEMFRPPGMPDDQWEQYKAYVESQKTEKAKKPPRKNARTAAPSPTPHDSAAAAPPPPPSTEQAPPPPPPTAAPVTVAGNGQAPDAGMAALEASLKEKLKNL
jgi:hypothetical protein